MNNVSKNRWQVRIAASIIFVLGFAAGILALNVYRSLARGELAAIGIDELSERLQLTADQKTKVQEIFGDTREQLRAVRRETEPRMNEIRRQADGRLQTVLTPEQWQTVSKHSREMRQRRGGAVAREVAISKQEQVRADRLHCSCFSAILLPDLCDGFMSAFNTRPSATSLNASFASFNPYESSFIRDHTSDLLLTRSERCDRSGKTQIPSNHEHRDVSY